MTQSKTFTAAGVDQTNTVVPVTITVPILKAAFIEAYRAFCLEKYGACNDGLMAAVKITLTTERIAWIWDGPGSKYAWKAIGCKGKLTLKGLRALA